MKKNNQYNQGITKKNTNTETNFIEFPEGNEKIWKKSKIRPRLERSKKGRKKIKMSPNVLKCLQMS